MALRGRMDGVLDGLLRGWLWDPDRPEEALTGEVHLDGQLVGRLRADLPRPDLEAIGFGAGGAGFAFALPAAAQDGQTHQIALIAEQRWLPVTVDLLTLVIPPRLHMLRGRIERVAAGQCQGWVWDSMRPEQPVWLDIVAGGRLLGRHLADQPRPGLREAGIGEGRHGFSISLAALKPRPAPGTRLELRCLGAEGEWSWSLGEILMPALAPPPRPAIRLSRRETLAAARKAEGERDLAQAARLLEAGLLDDPEDFDLLSIRARIHLAQQEFEPAERLARAALRRNPGHPRALLILARVTTALGRHEEAAAFWGGIGPEESAWRERLVRRPRSLLALGRPGEALNELAQALRSRPEDAEIPRRMAEMAEAAGAPRAALAHWRRVLRLAPEDRAAEERVAALQKQLAPPPPEALPSPLADPTLRDWRGPLNGIAGAEPVWPSPGLTLRALGGRLHHTPIAPQQRRPGELPVYGLALRAEGGGGDIGFALAAEAARQGLRMGLEVTPGAAGLPLHLVLRRFGPDGRPAGERLLRATRLPSRPQLLRFDLALEEGEANALRAAGLELLVRLPEPGACLLHPPRPLARLEAPMAASGGFESLGLPFTPAAPAPRADGLTALACPFTSISVAAPREALAETVTAVLEGTAAPFECVLAEEPDWPAELAQGLRDLAARDPRFRLLPAAAPSATGWVALIEAPPAGGPDWLATLHEAAMLEGRAEAPGVLLEWCAPAD
jgi:tetratricopeptide (TPR) repeat protein